MIQRDSRCALTADREKGRVLGQPETDWQFSHTGFAQGPCFLKRLNLHNRDDDCLDIVTAIADQ